MIYDIFHVYVFKTCKRGVSYPTIWLLISRFWIFEYLKIYKFQQRKKYLIQPHLFLCSIGKTCNVESLKQNIATMIWMAMNSANHGGSIFLSNQSFWQLLLYPWLLLTPISNAGWFICLHWWGGGCLAGHTCLSAASPILSIINQFQI